MGEKLRNLSLETFDTAIQFLFTATIHSGCCSNTVQKTGQWLACFTGASAWITEAPQFKIVAAMKNSPTKISAKREKLSSINFFHKMYNLSLFEYETLHTLDFHWTVCTYTFWTILIRLLTIIYFWENTLGSGWITYYIIWRFPAKNKYKPLQI